jgi:membrane dipeptidase
MTYRPHFAPALAIALLAACATAPSQSSTDPQLIAERALRAAPVFDGHNDLPWTIRGDSIARMDPALYDLRTRTRGHTDIERLRAGHVGAQFWSVYVPGEYADSGYARVQLEQIDIARRVIERYPDALELALRADDVRPIQRRGRIASFLGMEGGHALENSLGALRSYYDLGVRYMTLTHNVTLDWADAGNDTARHGGLTDFGRDVVREMNRLGMLVDLSHASDGVMSDALNVSEAPVIFSHSSARALTNVRRNVPDSILRRIPANGGVVMVTFVPGFVSQEAADHGNRPNRPRATLAQVADHIEHIRRVAGVESVGIGSDFDGISTVPVGLEDVSTFPALFTELARRGWSERELRMLASGNILRALRQAELVAERLRRLRAAEHAG